VDLLQRADERHAIGDEEQHGNNAAVSIGALHHKEQGVAPSRNAADSAVASPTIMHALNVHLYSMQYTCNNNAKYVNE